MEKRRIYTMEDVHKFLRYVLLQGEGNLGLGWDFHPDDDFSAYGKPDADEPLLSDEDAAEHNRLIDRCFEVCDKFHKDIYKLTLDLQRNEC